MKTTYLIQRLCAPYPAPAPETGAALQKLGESFSFGGGLPRGGLTKQAYDLLSSLWSWDYMGAAEFEFGALLRTLTMMVTNTPWCTAEIAVQASGYNWKERKNTAAEGTLYYLGPKSLRDEALNRIRNLDDSEFARRLHEPTRLYDALSDPESRVRGWLELDNGFLFFADVEMFNRAKELFAELLEKAA